VPYTIIIYPLLSSCFPRLWYVLRKHGYVTAADFVSGRFGNRWLALAITIHRHRGDHAVHRAAARRPAGVIGAMASPARVRGRYSAIIAFRDSGGVHVFGGLRAPAAIAVVKDLLIYVTAFAAVVIVPIKLGGFGAIFAAVPRRSCCLRFRRADHGRLRHLRDTGPGSAFALLLYPHTYGHPQRHQRTYGARKWRAAAGLYVHARVLALLGFFALADGVDKLRNSPKDSGSSRIIFAGAGVFLHNFPSWFVGVAFAASNCALVPAVDHVDRRGNLFTPQHLS